MKMPSNRIQATPELLRWVDSCASNAPFHPGYGLRAEVAFGSSFVAASSVSAFKEDGIEGKMEKNHGRVRFT